MSAEALHKTIEQIFLSSEDLQINMAEMREYNKHLFWNLVYYFNDYHLPFEFILPYEDTKLFD